MDKYVICKLDIQGFHCWPDAPKELEYLSFRHRHVFVIRVHIPVQNNNRQIEFITKQDNIKRLLMSVYGCDFDACDFGSMSCEDIAEFLMKETNAVSVEVLEDGCGGAKLVRK